MLNLNGLKKQEKNSIAIKSKDNTVKKGLKKLDSTLKQLKPLLKSYQYGKCNDKVISPTKKTLQTSNLRNSSLDFMPKKVENDSNIFSHKKGNIGKDNYKNLHKMTESVERQKMNYANSIKRESMDFKKIEQIAYVLGVPP